MTNSQVLSRNEVTPATRPRLDAGAGTAARTVSLPITDAVTVRPEEPIHRAIRLLTRSRLSALPVVDANGALVGLITEHDLLIRLTSRHRSWWAALWADHQMLIGEYRKATGTTVREVMGPPPIPLPADASVQAAADLLAQQGLREVPVVAAGRVVGVVSRPSLLALAELTPSPAGPRTDGELVAEMKTRLRRRNHGCPTAASGCRPRTACCSSPAWLRTTRSRRRSTPWPARSRAAPAWRTTRSRRPRCAAGGSDRPHGETQHVCILHVHVIPLGASALKRDALGHGAPGCPGCRLPGDRSGDRRLRLGRGARQSRATGPATASAARRGGPGEGPGTEGPSARRTDSIEDENSGARALAGNTLRLAGSRRPTVPYADNPSETARRMTPSVGRGPGAGRG